ncbi:histidinol-phosphate aminotransferase family protein [Bacteriovoracaceae bacterium]|nr:histidinol-phosphate aminotransferase family protein [Bacteriovoracaceae bacterium]
MSLNNNLSQAEKYDLIKTQHGGYYRHGFIDHAYLYNLYFPPEAILSKFKKNMHNLVLNYPVAQDALAELTGEIIDQPPERIVVGNGAAELIKIISGQIAKKIIVPVPSFNEYVNAAPKKNVIEFPLEFPSFHLDVDKFALEAIKVNADIAIVVTPNNPTSMLVPKDDLIRLARKLESHNCLLVIDESFLDFAEHPEKISLENEIEEFPNMAILKSMSKSYGIGGIRIGYMLSANSKFTKLVRASIPIWNINGFAEEFLRLLPDYKQEFIDSCKQVRSDRDKLYHGLCRIDGMTVYKPDANFVFCRLPDNVPNASAISKELFIKHNMYIKDCAGKSQPDSNRYLRIASRKETENMRLVEALIDILKD